MRGHLRLCAGGIFIAHSCSMYKIMLLLNCPVAYILISQGIGEKARYLTGKMGINNLA
jgi:hypothetical protein